MATLPSFTQAITNAVHLFTSTVLSLPLVLQKLSFVPSLLL